LALVAFELDECIVFWFDFVTETVVETLRSAAEEYDEAVKGERIRNVVEYQDARGFVLQAEKLFGTIGNEVSAKDSDAAEAIRAALADLKSALPGPMPPKTAQKDASVFLGQISRIELQLSRIR
jgi:hypothetical protein